MVKQHKSRGVVIFLTLVSTWFLSGCVFFDLQKSIEAIDDAVKIRGVVDSGSVERKPVLVALYRPGSQGRFNLVDFTVQYGSGEYEFLTTPGAYYLLAFEDVNEDFTFQHGERLGWYATRDWLFGDFNRPELLNADLGDSILDANISLRDPEVSKDLVPELFSPAVKHAPLSLANNRLGEVVDLDDAKLDQNAGQLGMWEPDKFIEENYHGIFFLEPFDSEKTPILFVHGLSGSGYVWRPIISAMDRSKFQPWILQYPSGLRLDFVSRTVDRALNQLAAKYKYDSLIVVAHSMGGLVARAFINQQVAKENPAAIETFISISTPWGGHSAAASGVSNMPVVVPAWYDLVPGSPFIANLTSTPLPQSIDHHLLFTYRTRLNVNSVVSGENTDGTVTIKSQLIDSVQHAAADIRGYHEDHVSVLKSDGVSNHLNSILNLHAD